MSSCCCNNDEGHKRVNGKTIAISILSFVLGIISIYLTFSMFEIYEAEIGNESAPYILVSCILNLLIAISFFLFGILALVNKRKYLCSKECFTCESIAFAGISALDTVLLIIESGAQLPGTSAAMAIFQLTVYVGAVTLLVLSFTLHQYKKLFRIIGNGLLLGYIVFIIFYALGSDSSGDVVSSIMYFVYIAYFTLQIISYLENHKCCEETSTCENDGNDHLSCLDEEEKIIKILSGYKDLLEREAITQEEFDDIKKQLLGE